MDAGLDRDFQLGSDAVRGGDQHRIAKTGPLEVEQAAEAADLGIRAGAGGRANHRLDEVDQPVTGIDINA
ncbi:hypothetical protein BN961_01655 [Afipia felis]|uniref:Uncharacterized protein n=1 Tax=Afipia felis TaxID=1035 RepID=A0A090MLG0_AFIFE|nr:hypothetical protein BN961_01655 [Afipia felis]